MKKWIFSILVAAACAAPFFVKRVPQFPDYHDFADKRPWLGIVNFGDVASNVPFLPVGLLGLFLVLQTPAGRGERYSTNWLRLLYGVFFFGVFLTTFGSAYYHLAPDNFRVMWDRIPIAVACGSLLIILLAERVSERASKIVAFPWMAFSIGSVVYWYQTESAGEGDLRFWGLAQFLPALAIPAGILLFPKRYTHEHYYFWALLCYVAAKVFETFDRWIYNIGGWVSGHSLKHVAAAAAAFYIYKMLTIRRQGAVL